MTHAHTHTPRIRVRTTTPYDRESVEVVRLLSPLQIHSYTHIREAGNYEIVCVIFLSFLGECLFIINR